MAAVNILAQNQTVPWFGRLWEMKHAATAGVGSLFLCYMYYLATKQWSPEYTPGTVEFIGTATSLWSVWITQKRNVLALPIGIVSVLFMGWFFLTIELPGQMLLHWLYYVPVQFWAWYHWRQGGVHNTELIVTKLDWPDRVRIALLVFFFTIFFGAVLKAGWDNTLYTYWDASIVAASVIAMILLSTKKVESWYLWIFPVNVSAIGLYLKTDAQMFAALYCLFLVMAFVGLYRWHKAEKAYSR